MGLRRWIAVLLASVLAACAIAPASSPAKVVVTPRVTQFLQLLPPGERWLAHFRDDLLPFWNKPDAWGEPRGNFPTFRCNSGKRFDPAKPCEELANAPQWIKENLNRDFVRMKSRQTYFYGVAFHLTGDPEMLVLARAGAAFIRQYALDPVTGSAVSYWEGGDGGKPASGTAQPALLERTSQDLAYAQLGLAMVYYLTRDETVLADILKLKDHIFQQYWHPKWKMLRWTAAGSESHKQELVAQLDQINAYMLLLAPILPEPHGSQWKRELVMLADVMIERFFSPEQHVFWGTIHDSAEKKLGSRHTDFGHTAKALWMIERIGRLAGEKRLVSFAEREATHVLNVAYLPDSGSWGSRLRADGRVSTGKEWWIFAELNQIAATLALNDPQFLRYPPSTFRYWLSHMVDHMGGEVYGWVNGETNQPAPGPKIHHWKNGYHSAEHALVAYITTQALRDQPVTLYFAFASPTAVTRPYLFDGVASTRQRLSVGGADGTPTVKMTFSSIR